jgi:hypothetical protein
MGMLNWRSRLPELPPRAEVTQALRRLVPPVPSPTDEELGEIWMSDGYGAEIRARHIVFLVSTNAARLLREYARRQAESARARAVAGENFVALVHELTTQTADKERGGDLSYFSRGRMVAEFEQAAFALQPGQISDVVETPFGYHVIRVEDRRQVRTCDKASFREQLMNKRRQHAIRDYLEELAGRACVELESGAEVLVRQLAQRPDSRPRGKAAKRPLVRYRGGVVTVAEMASVVHNENSQHLAQIAIASNALLQGFLRDQALRKLVWSAANPSLARRAEIRHGWSITRRRVRQAPGSRLLWLADLLFSRKSVEEVLEDAVIDMRREYFEALADGRTGKARWIRLRGTWTFLCAAWELTPIGTLVGWVRDLFK